MILKGLFLHLILLNKATVIGKKGSNQDNFYLYVRPQQVDYTETLGESHNFSVVLSYAVHFLVNSRHCLST